MTEERKVVYKGMPSTWVLFVFGLLTITFLLTGLPWWVITITLFTGIFMVFYTKTVNDSARETKDDGQTTRGISWDSLGLGAAILWFLVLIGPPFYAVLWVGNKYFPKEVRTVTYVPHWDAHGKISATCWDIDPGLYTMSCSGNISQKPFVGERYSLSCTNGNPPSDVQLQPEELEQMIIKNLPELGRALITGSDINNPSSYVPVKKAFRVTKKNRRFCVTLNMPQRKGDFETVKGSIQVEILKKRFPWLP